MFVRRHISPPRRRRVAVAAAWALAFAAGPASADDVTIAAAASTLNAINGVADLFESRGLGTVRRIYGASSSLARQIEDGLPADIYLSADPEWAGYLESRGLFVAGSRAVLFTNRLVLATPGNSDLTLEIASGDALVRALGSGHFAMADPSHVPAGKYAKRALEQLGVWQQVAPRAVYSADVRATLALISRGEVAAGIVYGTDVTIDGNVRTAGVFPLEASGPIAYHVALIAGERGGAAPSFLEFLFSTEARALYRRHRFHPPDGEG